MMDRVWARNVQPAAPPKERFIRSGGYHLVPPFLYLLLWMRFYGNASVIGLIRRY